MKSPLKKEPPKKRWVYRPIPNETWEAIRSHSPAFVCRAIAYHEELLRFLISSHRGEDKDVPCIGKCLVCQAITKAEGR